MMCVHPFLELDDFSSYFLMEVILCLCPLKIVWISVHHVVNLIYCLQVIVSSFARWYFRSSISMVHHVCKNWIQWYCKVYDTASVFRAELPFTYAAVAMEISKGLHCFGSLKRVSRNVHYLEINFNFLNRKTHVGDID